MKARVGFGSQGSGEVQVRTELGGVSAGAKADVGHGVRVEVRSGVNFAVDIGSGQHQTINSKAGLVMRSFSWYSTHCGFRRHGPPSKWSHFFIQCPGSLHLAAYSLLAAMSLRKAVLGLAPRHQVNQALWRWIGSQTRSCVSLSYCEHHVLLF